MKLTKETLKRIIKEELEATLGEMKTKPRIPNILLENVMTWEKFISTLNAIILVKKGEQGAKLGVAIGKLGLLGATDVVELLAKEPNKVLDLLAKALGISEGLINVLFKGGSFADVVRASASLPDERRTKAGYLSMLDFDDEYLKIIDNKLENAILTKLLDVIKAKKTAQENIQNFNVNEVIEDFIRDQFRRDLKGAPRKSAATVKAQSSASVTGTRGKQKLGNLNPLRGQNAADIE